MGRVTTEILVENLEDQWAVKRGLMPADQARRVTVPDALVDTGATFLSLPAAMVATLGLAQTKVRQVVTSVGPSALPVYEAVRLTIQGRDCLMQVLGVPDGVPPLVGQLPLEALDLVVNPQGQELTGNPAHGGEWVLEAL